MPVAGFFSSSSTPRTISVHLAQCIHSQLTPLSVSLVLFEFVNHAPCEGAISHSCTTNRDLTKIVGTMNKHPRGILYEDLSNRILVKMSTNTTDYRTNVNPIYKESCPHTSIILLCRHSKSVEESVPKAEEKSTEVQNPFV
jgi:hypothetical protein